MRTVFLSLRYCVDDAGEDFLADPQFLAVVAHRDPQTEDFGAAFLDHILRQDDVADRLRHLPAFEVDQEAVGQHCAEGRPLPRRERHHQRALEPPAMLVAAFEVHVRRPAQIRLTGQYRFVARARVEPDVEDVALAFELRAAA